jgi:hypothetical protein
MKEKGVEIISTFSSSRILLLSQALCRAFENQPRSLVKHWILCFKIDYLSKLGIRSGDMSPLISGPFRGFNLSPDPLVPTWGKKVTPGWYKTIFAGGGRIYGAKMPILGERSQIPDWNNSRKKKERVGK